jgi:branched-chain amino acid transport system substrate-binding protein
VANTTTAATTGTTSSEASTSTASSGGSSESVAVGLKFTGGKEGKASASLSPITIGFTDELGGTPAFPEMKAGANAGVQFVNEHAGGIEGHPLKLLECYIQTEEDGTKCAAQFLNAKVPIIELGLSPLDDASLYKAINGKIPIQQAIPSSPADNSAQNAYSFIGGNKSIWYGVANDIQKIKPKYVAVLAIENPGGKYSQTKVVEPLFTEFKITFGKSVYYPETVTTPVMVSALQSAGGSKADAIFLNPSAPGECANLFSALKQLNIKVPIFTTSICNSPAFVDGTGAGPEDWHIWGFGPNARVAEPETTQFAQIMEAAGQKAYVNIGFAGQAMGGLFAIAKFANTLGAGKLTTAAFTEQFKTFKGPVFMTPGAIDCAKPIEPQEPGICGISAAGATFKEGKWQSLGTASLPANLPKKK